jgi:hypothetical protein
MATVIGGLRVDLTLNSAAFIRDMAKSYVRNRTEKCRFSSPFCLGTAILDEFLLRWWPGATVLPGRADVELAATVQRAHR